MRVDFIANWNNSDFDNTYDANTLLASSDLSMGPVLDHDLKLLDVDIDGIKLISEDFFQREPREGKLEFRINDWLKSEFTRLNDNELNYVLYYNIDGDLLDSDDTSLVVGDEIDGEYITKKEVLLQQYSNIIVKVYNNSDKCIFTGLVDKSDPSYGKNYISLTVKSMDFLIKEFSEQLIYNVVGNETYGYVVSYNVLKSLLDKIESATGLNLITNFSLETIPFVPDNTQVIDFANFYLTANDLIMDSNDFFMNQEDETLLVYNYNTFESQSSVSLASGVSLVTIKQNIKFYYRELDGYAGNWNNTKTKSYVLSEITEIQTNQGTQPQTDEEYYTINQAVSKFQIDKDKSDAFYDEDNGYYLLALQINSTQLELMRVTQEYYSIAIPVYTKTYKYLDLNKLIFLVNNITVYSDADGQIVFRDRDQLVNAGESISGAIIVNPIGEQIKDWKVSAVQREDSEFDALNNIWYDSSEDEEEDGKLYNELDSYIKNKYALIFRLKYPLEYDGEITQYRAGTKDDLNITEGSILKLNDEYWCVVESKLVDKKYTKHRYTIRAYMIDGGELDGYLFS